MSVKLTFSWFKCDGKGQENPDGGKYTSGFCNALDGSRDFLATPNGIWQESSNGAKRMSGFHNAPDSSGDFCAASNGLWQENSEGAKYASFNLVGYIDSD